MAEFCNVAQGCANDTKLINPIFFIIMKGLKLKTSYSLKPKVASEQQQDIKLKQAAKMYEKQFLREMMKAMRSTVTHSELSKPGFAEKIYTNQLDDQYVEQWGDTGGIGLSDLIFEQIKERYGKKNVNRPKGPIPLDKGPQFIKNKDNMFKLNKTDKDLGFILPLDHLDTNDVTSPWAGKVKQSFSSNMNQVLEIEHDVGLSSLITFSGSKNENIQKEQKIKAGDVIGSTNPMAKFLYWKLT